MLAWSDPSSAARTLAGSRRSPTATSSAPASFAWPCFGGSCTNARTSTPLDTRAGTRLGPDLQVTWTDLSTSVISMGEKRAHAVEIQETARRHAEAGEEIEERARAFAAYDPVIRPHRAGTAS